MNILASILLVIHSFALWGDLGVHFEPLDATSSQWRQTLQPLGGAGTDIGLGYRMNQNGFLWQTGVQVGYRYSAIKAPDFQETYPMWDTEMQPMEMYFDFTSIHEQHQRLHAQLSLLFGYEMTRGFYFLAGPKVGYAFYHFSNVHSQVTTQGRYDEFIGLDGAGLFADMPDHFFDTQLRTTRTTYRPVPTLSLFFEIGYNVPLRQRRRSKNQSVSIALFAEYGGILTGNNTTSIPRATYPNQPLEKNFYPWANPFLFQDASRMVGNLLAGVKITYLLSSPPTYNCHCD